MTTTNWKSKKLYGVLYILALTIVFLKIYDTIFDQKVNLVGDNASYYILGNAIANGDGYHNIQHLNKEAHYHYPPGYPFLIAGVIKLFSNDFNAIKIFNGVLLWATVLLLYFLIKRVTGNIYIAFASAVLSLLNFHLLNYATIMMSEIPFLFFSLISIWLLLKVNFKIPIFKNWFFILLVICVAFSLYIRSVGLALFLGILIYLIQKKHWSYALSLITGFVILHTPWIIRSQHAPGNSYLYQLSLKNPYQPELGTLDFSGFATRIWGNIERYITKEIPSSLVYTHDVTYSEITPTLWEWVLGISIVAGVLFGLFKLPKLRILLFIYVFSFFGILILWPSVWYGTRFMVPMIPLFIFLLTFSLFELFNLLKSNRLQSIGIFDKFSWNPIILLILIIYGVWYGTNSIPKLKNQAEGTYADNYNNYFELAKYIKENTPDNSVTCARKEGLFHLFSKKYVIGYQKTLNREDQIEYLKKQKVDYVVAEQLGFSSTSKYLIPAIDRYPKKFKIIKELKNPNTYLMQFLPDLGYWGDWKNEKRNGLGTYVWEDGQKYIGYWKDDIRHGKGVVSFSNGDQLSGVWENGALNGEAIKTSSTGVVLERSFYKNNQKIKVIDESN